MFGEYYNITLFSSKNVCMLICNYILSHLFHIVYGKRINYSVISKNFQCNTENNLIATQKANFTPENNLNLI